MCFMMQTIFGSHLPQFALVLEIVILITLPEQCSIASMFCFASISNIFAQMTRFMNIVPISNRCNTIHSMMHMYLCAHTHTHTINQVNNVQMQHNYPVFCSGKWTVLREREREKAGVLAKKLTESLGIHAHMFVTTTHIHNTQHIFIF